MAQATSMMLLKKRLLKRLEDEHYLDYSGETREDIVRYATLEFENRDKRPVDIARRPVGEVKIPGLRGTIKGDSAAWNSRISSPAMCL